jgi:hypothetical protein
MRFIRFIVRAAITWSLLLFVLGAAFAASPHGAEDLLGLIGFALLAGGVLSLFRRPANAAGTDQAAQAPADAAPPVVEAAAPQIPGARGARMALDQHPASGTPPDSLAVCFHGQVKAYVTRDSGIPSVTSPSFAPRTPSTASSP